VKKLSRAERARLEEPATMDEAIVTPNLAKFFLSASTASGYTTISD
jgi:hypothetical protein